MEFTPGYVKLYKSGELKRRGEFLWSAMESCNLCPRLCAVNRIEGERGVCGADAQLQVASYHPHFGEEAPLVGNHGSGTIFMSHCNLRCSFCINWEISHRGEGSVQTVDELAKMMLALQRMGCSNINVVTPTHYSPHILLALHSAAEKGLNIPLVYNTCGWERMEVLQLLDGVVDIYLCDFKYYDSAMAARFSCDAHSYPQVTQQALLEMHRQVGEAVPKPNGLMYGGLMIRHLVMPNNVSGTQEVLGWIYNNLGANTYINLMSQYMPVYKAQSDTLIGRRITSKEYMEAVGFANKLGFTNLEIQGMP